MLSDEEKLHKLYDAWAYWSLNPEYRNPQHRSERLARRKRREAKQDIDELTHKLKGDNGETE